MANDGWMIYGANGYTGKIVAETAVEQGKKPVLAGRSRGQIKPLAEKLNLEWVCFDLNSPASIEAAITDLKVVLHCAGPFSATSAPMVAACLKTQTHYLDITGEIPVFDTLQQLDQKAKAAGCTLMPGVGFDVVPTDCLAGLLKEQIENPTHLEMAFGGGFGVSPGTSKTIIEMIPGRGLVRRDGEVVTVPTAYKRKIIQFSAGKRYACMTIPWGDISTAYYSTKIPNIEIYTAVPRGLAVFFRLCNPIVGMTGLAPIQRFLKGLVDKYIEGPAESTRQTGRMHLWGKVTNARGESQEATLDTPEGYRFTVISSLASVDRVLQGSIATGTLTPAMAFGPAFVTELEGTTFSLREPDNISAPLATG